MGASLAGGVVQSLGWEDSLELGNGNPLQCSRLKTPLDRGLPMADHSPWGRKESDTTYRLSNKLIFRSQFSCFGTNTAGSDRCFLTHGVLDRVCLPVPGCSVSRHYPLQLDSLLGKILPIPSVPVRMTLL